jgi:hypothetical protein
MRYETPKYEKMNIEVEDILSASSEQNEGIVLENVVDGVADYILNVKDLFTKNK